MKAAVAVTLLYRQADRVSTLGFTCRDMAKTAAKIARLARHIAAGPSARALTGILVLAALVRLVLAWSVADVPTRIEDERHYYQLAGNIFEGHGLAWGPDRPTSIRPPLYPAFVASLWAFTVPYSLEPIRLAQVALLLGSVLVLFGMTRRLYNDRVALVATAFFAFYPSLLFSGVLVLTETLFIFLFLLALGSTLNLLKTGSCKWAFTAGLTLGLAALTRSIVWPMPFVLVLYLSVALQQPVRRRLGVCLILLVGYSCVVGPWALRNSRIQHTPVVVDTMGGLNLLMGNYEFTPEARMWDAVSIVGPTSWAAPLTNRPDAGTWTEGQKERWARTEALKFMAAHPLLTLRRSMLKLADLWGLEREWLAGLQQGLYRPPTWFALLSSTMVVTTFPVLLILAVWGIFRAKPAHAAAHYFLLLTVTFICLMHAVTFGHSRYHLPLIPILSVYAASVVVQRRTLLARLRVATMVSPLAVTMLCVAVWTREILFRDAHRLPKLFELLSGAQ
jgi:4-amino-4-deoxy-L-arabinose transferase-like glycosyltransferase